MPDWLFLSSALPPHRRKLEMLHTLPLEEFVKTVAERYNAVPSEAMKNHEALNLFGHILQSDFQLLELHHYSPECPLPTMFAVFGGRSDPSTPRAELAEWRDYTSRREQFQMTLFDGDHFYLVTQREQLTAEIVRLIQRVPNAMSVRANNAQVPSGW